MLRIVEVVHGEVKPISKKEQEKRCAKKGAENVGYLVQEPAGTKPRSAHPGLRPAKVAPKKEEKDVPKADREVSKGK